MGRIKVLDPETVNRVAAGEVVQRPASVVKELVENAFDAGATVVKIVLSGKELEAISVSDNGCGIAEEDVLIAFERHATSKISSSADLERIGTLGFRGEALPSIAAVSRMTLKTRAVGALAGTLVEIEGGKVVNFLTAGAPSGTTVTVRDLFFNTPARRKFLSSWKTESAAVTDTAVHLALGRPDVSLSLRYGEREVFGTTGAGLLAAISAVYGETVAGALVPVSAETEGMRLEGFVGRPALARTTRRSQTLIINGRYVKHAGLNTAVYIAYGTLLPTGKHPFFVLHLGIDPGVVDVNVHPQKFAVRFSREREVADFVRGAVRSALFGKFNLIPGTRSVPVRMPVKQTSLPEWDVVLRRLGGQESRDGAESPPAQRETAGENLEKGVLVKEERASYGDAFPALGYLGFLHPTYLLATGPEGLYLVDQHAAHERILFEEYGSALARGGITSQMLVEPVVLDTAPVELPAVAGEIERYGFVVEPFGEGTCLLRAIPVNLSLERARLLLADLLACLAAGDPLNQEKTALASMACHSAVKAGEPLAAPAAVALLGRLAACNEPFTCPHGRPTVICLSRDELERRFGRR
ncbi:MAG: DNA mismatch repair endonuclease MutL [Bacillota bacterium]